MGAPSSVSVSAILSANSNIASAFATSPSYFGIGELGGVLQRCGDPTQTEVSTENMSVDLTKLASVQPDLGFYSPQTGGAGFSSLNLDVKENGSDALNVSFTSVAAAKAYFTNDAIDLGSLSGIGNTLNLRLELTEVTTAPSSDSRSTF